MDRSARVFVRELCAAITHLQHTNNSSKCHNYHNSKPIHITNIKILNLVIDYSISQKANYIQLDLIALQLRNIILLLHETVQTTRSCIYIYISRGSRFFVFHGLENY
jgi:hypothetical protein